MRFEAHASAEEFATACAAALRRVRTTQVDSTGLVTHWPHPFPQAEFERVERLAGQYPYTPENALQGNI